MCSWINDPDNGHESRKYTKLLTYLNSVPFRSKIEMDKNRESDAISMRYEIAEELDIHEVDFGPASVLEVIVALARIIDGDIMYDEELGNRTYKWFWVMEENLGLDFYDNVHYSESHVCSIVEMMLDRKFGRNGEGALFPCRGAARKEIWVQMNEFLDKYL